MVAVPISRTVQPQYSVESKPALPAPKAQTEDELTHWVAAGAIVAGGALLVTGHRRAGLAVAAAGTALALLEDQHLIAEWWRNLPDYLNQAQGFLDKVEQYMEEAAVQGKRLQGILRR